MPSPATIPPTTMEAGRLPVSGHQTFSPDVDQDAEQEDPDMEDHLSAGTTTFTRDQDDEVPHPPSTRRAPRQKPLRAIPSGCPQRLQGIAQLLMRLNLQKPRPSIHTVTPPANDEEICCPVPPKF